MVHSILHSAQPLSPLSAVCCASVSAVGLPYSCISLSCDGHSHRCDPCAQARGSRGTNGGFMRLPYQYFPIFLLNLCMHGFAPHTEQRRARTVNRRYALYGLAPHTEQRSVGVHRCSSHGATQRGGAPSKGGRGPSSPRGHWQDTGPLCEHELFLSLCMRLPRFKLQLFPTRAHACCHCQIHLRVFNCNLCPREPTLDEQVILRHMSCIFQRDTIT